mmetsp:Transcript_8304/g.34840  ORF Transcript_8304/g.34840 Transcript_8304/m.34840 type:complete len:357 (+) Transcript_8304:49-1119(+)
MSEAGDESKLQKLGTLGTSLRNIHSETKKISEEVSDSVKDRSKDVVEKGFEDVRTLREWSRAVVDAMARVFAAGVRDSVALKLSAVTPKFRAELLTRVAGFLVVVTALVLGREPLYMADWLYWVLLVLANEYINYQVVEYQFSLTLAARLDKSIIGVQQSVTTHLSTISDTLKFAKKKVKKTIDASIAAVDGTAPAPAPREPPRKQERKRARNKLLAKVLVAKIMSYTLIWAYLHELVDVVAYLSSDYLVSAVDFPITALLLTYFIAENRLLILKGNNFLERVEYIKANLFYNLGYGLIMTALFMYAPYGELWCSVYHLLLLCSQFKTTETSAAVLNVDPVEYAEKVCFRVVEYLI